MWLTRGGWVLSLAMAGTAAVADTSPTDERVVFHARAQVDDPAVRLGQVANLRALPLTWRIRASELVVAELPAGTTMIALNADDLATRARRQMPQLGPWLIADSTPRVSVTLHLAPLPVTTLTPSAMTCLVLLRHVARGQAIPADAVRAMSCTDAPPRHVLRYDRDRHIARTTQDLQPGDQLPALSRQHLAAISKGETVVSSVRTGALTVTRTGVALHTSTAGQPVTLAAGDDRVWVTPTRRSGAP